SLSFLSSCVHRHLPPFPTRRSSDLAGIATTPAVHPPRRPRRRRSDRLPPRRSGADPCERWRDHRQWQSRSSTLQAVDGSDQVLRSEEHTSELQSPDHIVCRLLLEKK